MIDLSPQQVECIALAVQHETSGKLTQGAVEVAEVVINRSRDADYPSTPCAVIYQKKQFSNIRNTNWISHPAWKATEEALLRYKDGRANTTTIAFHSLKKTPSSWKKLHFKFQIGNHRFYAKER